MSNMGDDKSRNFANSGMMPLGALLVSVFLWSCQGQKTDETPTSFYSPERTIAWDPGIPGDFVYQSYSVDTKADFGAKGDGTTDDTAALRSAIADVAAHGGGIVNVPAGTYLITDRLLIEDDYVVLRGAGPRDTSSSSQDGTHIKCDLQPSQGDPVTPSWDHSCIAIEKDSCSQYVLIESGATRGSDTLKLVQATTDFSWNYQYGPSTTTSNYETAKSSFVPGTFILVTQDNDEPTIYTVFTESNGTVNDWKEMSGWVPTDIVGQFFTLSAFDESAGTVKLDKGLYLDYNMTNPHCNPRICVQPMVKYVGVEDLHIYQVSTSTETLEKRQNIRMYNAAFARVKNIQSGFTNEIHVSLSNCYRCEVVDSFMHDSFDYSGGHAYGVDFFHRSTDCLVQNNIYRDLNNAIHFHVGATGNVAGFEYQAPNLTYELSYPHGIGSFHGHYATYNLMESCDGPVVGLGDWWGPTPYNTIFRSRFWGHSAYSTGPQGNLGLYVQDHSHYVNLVGNELRNASVIWVDSTSNNVLIHGNYLEGTGGVGWDSTIVDHTISTSLYLSSKPEFLGTKPFPIFGPETPGSDNTLPAEDRYNTLYKQ